MNRRYRQYSFRDRTTLRALGRKGSERPVISAELVQARPAEWGGSFPAGPALAASPNNQPLGPHRHDLELQQATPTMRRSSDHVGLAGRAFSSKLGKSQGKTMPGAPAIMVCSHPVCCCFFFCKPARSLARQARPRGGKSTSCPIWQLITSPRLLFPRSPNLSRLAVQGLTVLGCPLPPANQVLRCFGPHLPPFCSRPCILPCRMLVLVLLPASGSGPTRVSSGVSRIVTWGSAITRRRGIQWSVAL